MPPLRDPEIREVFTAAFRDRRVAGVILWEPRLFDYVRNDLSMTAQEFNDLLNEHIQANGKIDEVPETRPGYEYSHHYDIRMPVGGRNVYIEMRIHNSDPNDPIVRIVQVKDA